MKLALTADLHLTSRAQHPERFEALENILADLHSQEIDTLIIAGDLFDASRRSYTEFEQLCREPENSDLNIYLIPGNHDPAIDGRKIVADNLHVITTPSIRQFDDRSFLFLPYQEETTMGEALTPFAGRLSPKEWVLIAHGDWAGGLRTPNPAEPGVYMPLTRRDIEMRQPARVFLGHIHIAQDDPPVHYVGSPCGLDITETGRRRCLFYDTETDQVTSHIVHSSILFLNETFVIVPAKDEANILRAQIEARKQAWGLSLEEKSRVQLRVRVSGYSADRGKLDTILQEAFDGYSFYKGQRPDISDVFISDDVERQYIVEQVQSSLKKLDRAGDSDEPSADDILLKAMHIIYGG